MKTMALDGFSLGQTVSGCFLATQLPSFQSALYSHVRNHHQHPGLDVKKIRAGLIDLSRKMSHMHCTVR